MYTSVQCYGVTQILQTEFHLNGLFLSLSIHYNASAKKKCIKDDKNKNYELHHIPTTYIHNHISICMTYYGILVAKITNKY